ncbi:hypothetical protein Vretimale_3666 [Volvox reticuliferus]|uniref:Uncharacterized protein n=1 Tax=Volvox reticuliferus TaxID=1737510 RepID=A0A8J4D9H0_9CHLO|nr:hypothetical protein Vretifemale_1273 [Volvox reticuliferus]GIL98263.1 hypothetical protein Vretimale_3666 [Volvox reticuliferus]
MVGINHHTMLERQLSSAGCSTSYTSTPQLKNGQRTSCKGRGLRCRQAVFASSLTPRIFRGCLVSSRLPYLRCAAQQRPHRASQSPEKEAIRRNGQLFRPLGSVAASAATTSPPLPRRGDPDLTMNIPDAIPSLEQLEDLRSRAMKSSPLRASRLVQNDQLGDAGIISNLARPINTNSNGGLRGRFNQPIARMDLLLDPEDLDGSLDPSHASGNGSQDTDTVLPSPVHLHSALSRAVPPPQPLFRSQTSREGAVAGQERKVAFGPKRQPSRSSAALPTVYRTKAIKNERNWRQLPGLLEELVRSGSLDAFTASTFLTHLAQLVAKSPPASHSDVETIQRMQTTLLVSVELLMHEYRARQISNMTWALARLGLPSGAAFVRERMLPASYPLLPWYEPQHLSNTLWALATIGVAPDDEWLEEYLTVAFVALQKRALAPQHLANVLWALERMGIMPDQEWMAAYYDCVQAAVPTANPQDCSNILSCLALMRMHHQEPVATAALASHFAQRLQVLLSTDATAASTINASRVTAPLTGAAADAAVLTPTPAHSAGEGLPEPAGAAVDVSDQAIANSLWALAIMGVQPAEGLWNAIVAVLRQRLADPTRLAPGMHPVALTIVLWASSTLGRVLPATVTGLVYGRVRLPQMEVMEPRSLATMVWALATAPGEQARPPPDWVADAVAVSGRALGQLGAQAVSNMLYGLCQLGARPPPAWMSAVINHFHRNLGSEASGQSVSNVLWCLAKMGYRLNDEGMDILFGLVRSQLSTWQQRCQEQQEQCQQHGHKRQQQSQAVSPPPPFNAQEVSNVLYAIASMGYEIDPSGELSRLLLDAARARLCEANAQELSNMMWCMAVLQIRPPEPWLEDYFAAATARLSTFKSFDLAQTLYGAAKLRLPLHSLSMPADSTQAPTAGESGATATLSSAAPATATAAGSWVSAALTAAPQLIASANPQDLCNLSWGLVQLRVPVQSDSPLVLTFTSRLVALAGGCDPPQLALGVWALGKWRARPNKTQMERLEMATFRQVPSMRPHELAAMLSGFAGMGHIAPAEWLSDAVQLVAARSREFGPQEWTMVVYALARVQNDNSLTEMVLRLLPRLDRLPLPSLILISYSCGCMGPSPMGRQLVNRCLALLAAGAAAAPASGDITGAATDGARRDVTPWGKVKTKRAGSGRGFGSTPRTSAVQPQLHGASRRGEGAEAPVAARPVCIASLTPAELSALLWSAVRVGIKVLPRDFLDQFYSHTEPLLESLPASLVASYLWAAGRLRFWLPSRWRKLLLERAEVQVPEMRARELAMCMAGLLWLRMWPTSSLLRKLRKCYEAQRDQMPERVRKHADGALAVLTKRLTLARERERKYGCSRTTRLRWLARVWGGNTLAAAAGATGFRGKRVAAAAPSGRISRRQALQQGVLRKASPRPKGAAVTAKTGGD